MISSRIIVNGKYSDSLPVSDRGLQYGDGVWETIAIKQGKAIQLEAHLSRLKRGMNALSITDIDDDLLKREIAQHTNTETQCILKIIITRGSGGRGYSAQGCDKPTRILSLHAWPDYPNSYSEQGIDMSLCEARLSHNPQLAGFKHLNRLEQVLARNQVTKGFQEGLVRDYDGHIIEATMSNIFVLKEDGSIVTPDLRTCGIEGIARSCIIDHLHDMDVDVGINTVTLEDIEQAQALFLSNSIIQIWPVKQFQEISYPIPNNVKELQKRIKTVL